MNVHISKRSYDYSQLIHAVDEVHEGPFVALVQVDAHEALRLGHTVLEGAGVERLNVVHSHEGAVGAAGLKLHRLFPSGR